MDIVERLKDLSVRLYSHTTQGPHSADIVDDAIQEIEHLRALVEKLERTERLMCESVKEHGFCIINDNSPEG